MSKPVFFNGAMLTEWLQFHKGKQLKKGKKDGKIIGYTVKLIMNYGDCLIMDVDADYCLGFIDYLLNEYKTAQGKPLARVTARNYFRCLDTALNAAVRNNVISINPCKSIHHSDKIKVPETPRQFLSIEEIRQLIAHPCKRENVKEAYLFSCFCGLRISDILSLKWHEVEEIGSTIYINKVLHKTGVALCLPLSKEALRWFPGKRGGENEYVFNLPCPNHINKILKEWAKSAGVRKHITFHTARHTFATMMLTLGVDLYTTSKLLGHTNIQTTQIYARIINKKKEEAVNVVVGLF